MNAKAWSVWAAALLLAAPLAARGDVGSELPDDVADSTEEARFTVEENVLRVLAGAEQGDRPPSFWSGRIARLGPDAAPVVVDALIALDLRARELAEEDAERAESAPLEGRNAEQQAEGETIERERRIVRGALELLGREAVVPALEQRLEAGLVMPAVRGTLLDALAAVGSVEDLDLAIGLVWPAGGGAHDVEPLLPFLDEAVCGLHERDERTLDAVRDRVLDARFDVAVGLIRAASATESRDGLDMLSGLLGRSSRLDPVLLEHIGAVGSSVRVRAGDDLRDQVRAYLTTEDERVLRAAVGTLGDLRDESSVEPLIQLLDSENDALVRASIQSLRKTTGMGYPPDRLRWATWYLSENQWYQTRGAELLRQLDAAAAPDLARTLGELAESRIHRARIAERVARLLEHEDPVARAAACDALRRLGATERLPALVELLEDEDATVAAAALDALQRLSELELGADPDAWREALATDA